MASAERKMMIVAIVMVAASLLAGVAVAAAPSQVEVLANACAVCHGTDGQGAQKIPKLNNELEVFDFVVTMNGYVDGTERATIMDRIAPGLSEDEIKQLAEYFANLD